VDEGVSELLASEMVDVDAMEWDGMGGAGGSVNKVLQFEWDLRDQISELSKSGIMDSIALRRANHPSSRFAQDIRIYSD
jgi:hypothetical protein